jgi:flagellar capping protein FliD
MKSSLTDGRFEDFVKAYNHLYKNIGMVLKEEMKYSFITNDD